jgi:predicted oxidoreductase
MEAIAANHDDATLAQLAYAWLLRAPGNLLPILGTGKIERVRRAVEATSIELSRKEWFRLWKAAGGDLP